MLADHLLATAARRPDHPAVIAGARQLTYRELEEASNRVARGLEAAGVGRGDRVVIDLENDLETVVALYGVLKAGAAFVMVNPSTKATKLTYILRHSGARAMIIGSQPFEMVAAGLPALPELTTVVVGELRSTVPNRAWLPWRAVAEGFDESRLDRPGTDLDLAAILYTSGSTGEPKGVMLTHLNVQSATASIATYLQTTAEDVVLNVLPLSFGYGLTQLFPTVLRGATLVVERGIVYPHVALTQLAKHRATGFALVPTIATTLMSIDLSKYDLSNLRYITNAGAGMPPDLVRQLRRALPRVQLYLMYGQTECLRISYLDPSTVDERPESVGRGMPNEELEIVDEHGHPVLPGDIGELVVRGPHVMAGYWRQPEETERKLRPGRWAGERVLFTGDLFRRDDAGFFYFVARQDDIIKSRGEKVSPREVENVLYEIPGVLEAAVAGIPDPRLGQAVKAFVVLKPGVALDERDIKRHCASQLEDYMVPTAVEFLHELPKNDRGKIAKRELLAAAQPGPQ